MASQPCHPAPSQNQLQPPRPSAESITISLAIRPPQSAADRQTLASYLRFMSSLRILALYSRFVSSLHIFSFVSGYRFSDTVSLSNQTPLQGLARRYSTLPANCSPAEVTICSRKTARHPNFAPKLQPSNSSTNVEGHGFSRAARTLHKTGFSR
jgi:hypothetical protein